jgi:hypothetical protein
MWIADVGGEKLEEACVRSLVAGGDQGGQLVGGDGRKALVHHCITLFQSVNFKAGGL